MAQTASLTDRFGLPMTTSSPQAGDVLMEGLDLLLENNYGPEDRFREAITHDEGFALAHGLLAYTLMMRAAVPEAKESSDTALSFASEASLRERRLIEGFSRWIQGKGPEAIPIVWEHLGEFPKDTIMLRLGHRLYMLGCGGSGVANFPDHFLALTKSVAHANEDEWSFLGQYAFAHHETGQMEKALPLAERSLELRPTNAVAAHSATHVYFETGNHAGGSGFLGGWLPSFDKRASYRVHLSWHHALFELATGRYRQALDIYRDEIQPSVQAKKMAALNDSASLMWRLQIYGGTCPLSWPEVVEQALPAAGHPGPAFRDGHAALAFAGGGDEKSLGQMIDRLGGAAGGGDALADEVTLPLVKGIGAFAQEDYQEAVRYLEPVFPQLARIGGSHAQREVFEDTLLEAYLRAEQFDKAEDMLKTRLDRRESVRDTFWLARTHEGAGESEAARASVNQAKDGWQGADPENPEYISLSRLDQQTQ